MGIRMFEYLWKATFKKKTICQHPKDLYSKHDPEAEYNPSSFRDFLDYFEEHPDELVKFELANRDKSRSIVVSFEKPSKPSIWALEISRWGNEKKTLLHAEKRPLSDIRVIYFRAMETTIKDGAIGEPKVLNYTIGYQGLDGNGASRKKMITVV